ncbi:MAG: transaldolase, partial [Chloroflexi bacterium]|nr:transaldolase [Chloroflexota bacterium]
MSKLHELASLGQSIWLDYIRRSFLTSGKLQALIDLGLRGMTSNPTIFEKALAGAGGEYDADLERMAHQGMSVLEIYEGLAIQDIQAACDLLLPVYRQTVGADGYVSLEVNPELAFETEATAAEALRLWQVVARPNLMVKIPATRAGLPAITRALAAGVNVNVTLIFSLERYQEVIEAHLQGLEQRLQAGQPLSNLASVASFFISRLDSKVDQRLQAIIADDPERAALAGALLGKAAVANARLAYRIFREALASTRYQRLLEQGAQPQRPLWASTSTKNPAYSDILYVQELIGAHTVNTLPQNTIEAFVDHGEARPSVEDNLEGARELFALLRSLDISIEEVTQELEEEGVASFAQSFRALIASIAARREGFLPPNLLDMRLGDSQPLADAALEDLAAEEVIARIWRHDHTLWKPQPAEITNRLGWLHVAEEIFARLGQIEALTYAVGQAGYTHAVVLGMGGSSLAPELFSRAFPSAPAALRLSILDTTHPQAVLALARSLPLEKTLFIVSTKSGGTEETLSAFKFFYNRLLQAVGAAHAGDHF